MRRNVMVALVLALCGAASAQDAVGPEQRLHEWLAAFNSQDERTYAAYVHAHAPAIAKYIRDDHRYAVHQDGFSLLAIDEVTATEVHARLRDSWSDAVTGLTIRIDPAPPYPIVAADLAPPRVDAASIVPFESDADLVRAVRDRVRRQAQAKRFSGVVLVARGSEVLLAAASDDVTALRAGCAPEALTFNLASMGKMATATAVMQQVAAGKIDLDATLATYLPDYENRDYAQRVTVRQLLNHTGGAGDFFNDEIAQHRDEIRTASDLIARLDARAPEFPPGERFGYSNFGFAVLGRIVETVSGDDWRTYLADRVLTSNGVAACAEELPGLTRDEAGTGWADRKPGLERMPTPAGGFAASAADLHAFIVGLGTGRLLPAAARDMMLKGTIEFPGGKYALGFQEKVRAGVRSVGHGGTAPGINDELAWYPASGYVVIVLTRLDPPYGNRMMDFVANRMAVLAAADRASP